MKGQTFKDYQPEQSFPLQPDISEMIPEGHMVRIVNEMIARYPESSPKTAPVPNAIATRNGSKATAMADVIITPGRGIMIVALESGEIRKTPG